MSTIIRKFHGFYWTDFKEEEQWLEAQAANGLLLKHMGILFSKFEKDEPRERRYRLIFNMNSEELEMIEASGWTCLQETNSQALFYTDNPDAVEIITDDYGFACHFKKCIRQAVTSAVIMLMGLGLFNFYLAKLDTSPYGFIHGFDMSLITGVPILIMQVALIITLVWYIIKNARFIWHYKAHKLAPLHTYSKCVLRNKIRWGIFALVILSLLSIPVSTIISPDMGFKTYDAGDALAYDSEYLVPFESVDKKEWNRIKDSVLEYASGETSTDKNMAAISVETAPPSIMFKKDLTQAVETASAEANPESGEYELIRSYIQIVYVARSSKIADKYLEEEILIKSEWKNDRINFVHLNSSYLNDIQIPVKCIDYAGYEPEDKYIEDDEKPHTQRLYLRKGDTIMIVTYTGSENLKDKAELFANKLK